MSIFDRSSACPLCDLSACGEHGAGSAIGEGVGRMTIDSKVPYHTVLDRVFADGVLVAAAGDVIPRSRAAALGLLEQSDEPEVLVRRKPGRPKGSRTRAKHPVEDRMAGQAEEDR